ncbi:MAG TPA: hypothetical protein DIS96_06050 [Pusillimonas sp.]|nr:hypothetical protein [Pusillimonas sp.]
MNDLKTMTRPSQPTQAGAAVNDSLLATIEQFLYHEARLLDQLQYDQWLNLFTDEGTYWIPAQRGQTDPINVPSIIYENKDVLTMRVRRLADNRTYQTAPRPYTVHMVSNILLEPSTNEAHEHTVYSSLMVHEFRDSQHRLFSGLGTHVLHDTPQGLKIISKRIDLLDCDGLHNAFMSLL